MLEIKRENEEKLAASLGELKKVHLTIKEKANEEGNLFAGIHKDAISAALMSQKNVDLAPEYIDLDKPIKKTGDYDIAVKVGDKSSSFKLTVEAVA
jgi:ribosomal protein L9